MSTLAQRAERLRRRLARIDRVLQEATRRNLDPITLIERGISSHDRRAKKQGPAVHDMRGSTPGGSTH